MHKSLQFRIAISCQKRFVIFSLSEYFSYWGLIFCQVRFLLRSREIFLFANSFCMVREYLVSYFEAITSEGIGFRHFREGFAASLVVDVILVSKLSINSPFETNSVDLKFLDFFGTNALILPSPAWTFCSLLQSENECSESKNWRSSIAVSCGWCTVLLSCMQGWYLCAISLCVFVTISDVLNFFFCNR